VGYSFSKVLCPHSQRNQGSHSPNDAKQLPNFSQTFRPTMAAKESTASGQMVEHFHDAGFVARCYLLDAVVGLVVVQSLVVVEALVVVQSLVLVVGALLVLEVMAAAFLIY